MSERNCDDCNGIGVYRDGLSECPFCEGIGTMTARQHHDYYNWIMYKPGLLEQVRKNGGAKGFTSTKDTD